MTEYDEKVPHLLKKELQWFGGIIGRPIDEDSKMNPISPAGRPMEEEAALHIMPSPTLRPAQRIQIYNQQYWWRLLNTLHESFPLLTRLFGYFDFNRSVGIPYLTKYPPRHWSLCFLGDRLPRWCVEEYTGKDKKLVVDAALLDWAFTYSFVSARMSPIQSDDAKSEAEAADLLDKKLYTQPYVYLFEMDHHLFKFREEFLKQDPDYWLNHPFPELDSSKKYHFVLFRNSRNDIAWKELSEGEYFLLSCFREGATIDEACQQLEEKGAAYCEAALENLQEWFREWTVRGWLTPNDPKAEDLIGAICAGEIHLSHSPVASSK